MLTVRRARPADVDALVALEEASFTGDRMSRHALRRALGRGSVAIFVVDLADGAALAAAAVAFFRRGTRVARLYSIATDPMARGQGYGDALLAAVEAEAWKRGCDRLRLEVHENNLLAADWYRRRGFRERGRESGYYEDGKAAIRFEKNLGQTP